MSQKELGGFLVFESVIESSHKGAMPQVHIPKDEEDVEVSNLQELPEKKEDSSITF